MSVAMTDDYLQLHHTNDPFSPVFSLSITEPESRKLRTSVICYDVFRYRFAWEVEIDAWSFAFWLDTFADIYFIVTSPPLRSKRNLDPSESRCISRDYVK